MNIFNCITESLHEIAKSGNNYSYKLEYEFYFGKQLVSKRRLNDSRHPIILTITEATEIPYMDCYENPPNFVINVILTYL